MSLPRLLQRVREFCANPQDLVSDDDVVAMLGNEFGLPDPDARRLLAWLVDSGHLRRRPHVHVEGDGVVAREAVRLGPGFDG